MCTATVAATRKTRQKMRSHAPIQTGSAGFSRCGHYRYWLRRVWDLDRPQCAWIGLNPSTADACTDDPTLRRCIRFSDDWGYGSLLLVNLFAWRATDPSALLEAPDPVGPRTSLWLRRAVNESHCVMAAWGNGGLIRHRAHEVAATLADAHCLGLTALGMPRHPLYCPKHATPRPFPPQPGSAP